MTRWYVEDYGVEPDGTVLDQLLKDCGYRRRRVQRGGGLGLHPADPQCWPVRFGWFAEVKRAVREQGVESVSIANNLRPKRLGNGSWPK